MIFPSRIGRSSIFAALLIACAGLSHPLAATVDEDWKIPPPEARLRAYWWWLNGNVTKESITHDLTEMKAKGFGGAVIFDAGGAQQEGNGKVPHGATFFSSEWRELYKHTLREAARLGLEMSLNIQSGWNLGGPMVKAEDAAKKLVWSETSVHGPGQSAVKLAVPAHKDAFYRDIAVVALRKKSPPAEHAPIQNLAEKAMLKTLHFSTPDTAPLLTDAPAKPGEEDARVADVLDLTKRLAPGGTLSWNAPAGEWDVFRFGFTVGDHAQVSTSSDGWGGYALDVLDDGAFKRYWDAVVEPLIADAGPLAGKTLRYLHTDSWEVEAINWTPSLREEFRARRGYDLLPWLPVIAGRIVNSRDESNRFLDDFRKTLGDLTIDHHYRLFRDWAHKHGLEIHPESGGPHAVPIDAQRCLGWDDAPMSEFWAESWKHRIGDANRFFVKQPASAAHTYGHRFVVAEGFTSIGPHWQERLWENLKPAFDHACSEGLNRLVWHAFVCSPASEGVPGQQYFAGTHCNPNVTWWEKGAPFFTYLNRCQFMLQRGLPVADALYYYGDHVPNFAQLRASDPAKLGAGYDYDVITEEAILTRLAMRDGRLGFGDGTSYRLLVLPDHPAISLPVLKKLRDLVAAGATIIGSQPKQASGLGGFPKADAEVKTIGAEMWNRPAGKGRVVAGKTAREVLLADGIAPDFEFAGGTDAKTEIEWVHRRDGDAEIYFVANRGKRDERVRCTFRIAGKAPELWDAVSGARRFATDYEEKDARTTLPLDFAPCGSVFVVFREASAAHPPKHRPNAAEFAPREELAGAWTVAFDPKWGGPAKAEFAKLESWMQRPEEGIRFYSGTATYRQRFDLPANLAGKPLAIDLGDVRELAEVRLNGRSLGVVWSPPFRVELPAGALKPAGNLLEIEVVNFWPNRTIGDASLPPEKRLTKTNVHELSAKTPLMVSGLLGPVWLLEKLTP